MSYALRYYLPFNAARLSRSTLPSLLVLTPEGWGFFTRDPREEDIFPYIRNEDTGAWVLSSRWTFGFGRHGTVVSREAAMHAMKVEADATACRSDHSTCLNGVLAKGTEEAIPPRNLCGDIGLVWQEPVPWAWAESDVVMPLRVVRFEVSC